MFGLFKTIGFTGLFDIAFVSILIYSLIVWFKRSKAVFVLIGLSIVGVIYLAAREFNLQLLAAVFQGFFAVILIAVIVIFQEDIKHLFERVALWSLNRRKPRERALRLGRREVEVLVRTVTDLARDRIGALIVLTGKDTIVRHINGGHELRGYLTEALVKSLFNPESMGHDGAVIIDRDRVIQFGCHLPLSKDLKKLQSGGGTRHAAALGVAELSDALCLVVSEERGTISVAQNGVIDVVQDPERLGAIIESFYEELMPAQAARHWSSWFTHNWREKSMSVALTFALWFFFVHEGRLTYKAFKVPVDVTNLPPDLVVKEIRPSMVEVTLSGPRRTFYFVRRNRVKPVVNLIDATAGFQTRSIHRSGVTIPEKLSLENINPTKVRVILEAANP